MTPQKQPLATVIIVAAGQATRFGGNLPKQYLPLHGIPVLRHSVSAFLKCPLVGQICVVIRPEHQDFYKHAIQGLDRPGLDRLLPPVIGGDIRQESVYNALRFLNGLIDQTPILIHDAARPCIDTDDITRVIESLIEHQAVTLACPVHETLRRSSNDDQLGDIVDRSNLMGLQTPQGFHYRTIMDAHDQLKGHSLSDDTALVSQMGTPVHFVTGKSSNIKITRQEDITMAAQYLSPPLLIPRTGIGFDVHAFGDPSAFVQLGGIDIPHSHKLAGHSDADVVLHAITDALYGALADGDIGSHFPPSNNDFKGMDSALFLLAARDSIHARGGRIMHVDTVIMCEAPKIDPHRDAMRTRIASLLGLPLTAVSVKATTTEGLGFTGRREGIAVQAVATVLLPMEETHELAG